MLTVDDRTPVLEGIMPRKKKHVIVVKDPPENLWQFTIPSVAWASMRAGNPLKLEGTRITVKIYPDERTGELQLAIKVADLVLPLKSDPFKI